MLSRIRKSMADKDQGFTLIELLVVVIIIGILAAIAIPVFLNQRKKGVDATMKSDLHNAITSVETWVTDNSSIAVLPTTADATSSVAGTGSLVGVKASAGNFIQLVASTTTTGAYCLGIYNAGSTAATVTGMRMQYSSQGGTITAPSAWAVTPVCP